MEHEAFVYLWYDAPNKKYYLGKHLGTPDDTYTHSSTMWKKFKKDNIPEGVTRRILKYGTHEEMCILENKLLINRKKRCWDRYYNESLGDPRYVDQSGENHHNWKGGIKVNAPGTEYWKEYRQRPEVKIRNREFWKVHVKTPAYREYDKERRQRPERKEYMKEYWKTYQRKKKGEKDV
mgnify:FL=1